MPFGILSFVHVADNIASKIFGLDNRHSLYAVTLQVIVKSRVFTSSRKEFYRGTVGAVVVIDTLRNNGDETISRVEFLSGFHCKQGEASRPRDRTREEQTALLRESVRWNPDVIYLAFMMGDCLWRPVRPPTRPEQVFQQQRPCWSDKPARPENILQFHWKLILPQNPGLSPDRLHQQIFPHGASNPRYLNPFR
ncbi:hypothetical protein Ga0074812_1678 [Parafrankia irregularis]|uniref:Uncharacterized protein n=1 Tax=Parafrankia irregularis TaxID=795642 RepID=A0A0S4R1I3_9ACTN|nr:hypothetical protein Ga0074812_1678 [Parafrankia irregularis]